MRTALICAAFLLATPAHANGGHHGGGHHYGHHGWGWRSWGAPVIVGGIVIGGALTAAAVAENRAAVAQMRACARDFPTFSVATGTYVDTDGVARVCPYLY